MLLKKEQIMSSLKILYELYKKNQEKNVYPQNVEWEPRLSINLEKLYCSYKFRQVRLNKAEMEVLLILVVCNTENNPYPAPAIQEKLVSLKIQESLEHECILDAAYIRKVKRKINSAFKEQYGEDFELIKSNHNGYWLSINPAEIKALHM